MNVVLVTNTAFPEEVCGDAAAVCTKSNHPRSALRHAVESGHTSVLEHAVFTFRVTGLSRVALAQLTRHRLASFSVQSQRYVKVENPELVIPETIRKSKYAAEVESSMRYMVNLYERMVSDYIPAEDARYVLSMAIPTDVYITMNARELNHFFSLRCCNRAQWEIRQMADEMLKICKQVAPTLFKDAGPGCVSGHCPEKRPCGSPRQKDEWGA